MLLCCARAVQLLNVTWQTLERRIAATVLRVVLMASCGEDQELQDSLRTDLSQLSSECAAVEAPSADMASSLRSIANLWKPAAGTAKDAKDAQANFDKV